MREAIPRSDIRPLVAAAAATCMAYLTWWLQPYIVREMLESFRADASHAGLALSVELIATALSSLVIARFARGFKFRSIALSSGLVAIVGAAVSAGATSYGFLLFARLVTGLGEGGVLMVSMGVLAQMPAPDRAYAKVSLICNLFGVALGLLMQKAGRGGEVGSLVFPLLLLTLVGIYPLILFLPRSLQPTPDKSGNSCAPRQPTSVRVALLGVAVIVVAASTNSVWSFYFALGTQAGMDSNSIGRSIEYTLLVSSLGAIAAMILGTKFGRFAPLAIALCAQTVAIAVMSTSSSTLLFDTASDVYTASGLLAMPYFFGCAVAEDPSGRAATVVGATYLLAAAVSPYLGGAMIEQFGLQSIAWLVAGACTFAGGLFFFLEKTSAGRMKLPSVS